MSALARTLGAAWRRSLGRFGAWRWRFGARQAMARRTRLNTPWDRDGLNTIRTMVREVRDRP